tara:strand:- start:1914 stop:2363 length:450 start_codon:yes stop_codon:yes gene_type:complete
MGPQILSTDSVHLGQRALIVPEYFLSPQNPNPDSRVLVAYDALIILNSNHSDYVLGDIAIDLVGPNSISLLESLVPDRYKNTIGFERIWTEESDLQIDNSSRPEDHRIWRQTESGLLVPHQYDGLEWKVQKTTPENQINVRISTSGLLY